MEKAGFEGFQPEIESLLMGKEIIVNCFKIHLDIDKFTPVPTTTKKRKNDEEITNEGGKREMQILSNENSQNINI